MLFNELQWLKLLLRVSTDSLYLNTKINNDLISDPNDNLKLVGRDISNKFADYLNINKQKFFSTISNDINFILVPS